MSKLANSDYEEVIISCIMRDKKYLEEHEGEIKEELFFYEEHKLIIGAILSLYKKEKGTDILSVSDELSKSGALDYIGGDDYLVRIKRGYQNKEYFPQYLEELKELAYKRNVVEASENLIEGLENGDDINTCLDKFERATERLEASEEDNTLASAMGEIFEELNSGKVINKVKTGISIIDSCTNGIAPSELVTIGAKSGVGKSALAIRIAINMHKEGKKILIISREMSKKQVTERILLSHSGVTKEAYENRDLSDHDWVRIVETMEAFSTDQIVVDDKISTIAEIKQAVRKYKPDVLIVDYVQLLTPSNPRDSRERQVADISRELKKMTSDFDMIVIQLTQLAEKGLGNYKPSGESYTRESRAIYHDSNIVIYVHHVTEDKEIEIAHRSTPLKERQSVEQTKKMLQNFEGNGTRLVEVIVDKNRSGSVGSKYYWFSGTEMGYFPIC
ncbi:MAG: replicative DNA helicase [Romboutsia timonensis]